MFRQIEIRANASVRRMVEIAEQRVMHKARVEGRMFCAFQLPSSSWLDKAGVEHIVQPAVCNGRMKPIKRGGAIVEGIVRCSRCWRDSIVVPEPVTLIPDPPVPTIKAVDALFDLPTSGPPDGTDPATPVTT